VISTIQENAMKKLIFIGLCVLSSAAFATGTAVCASSPTAAASTTPITGDGANFVKVTFTPKCSANTHVAYEQNAVNFAAAGGSSKGKTVFGGSTGGGGVSPTGATCANGCAAGDATGATNALLTAASSS
jgi:hypothetical protein